MAKCQHKKAARFHENSPLYCPDCKYYLEYDVENNKIVLKLLLMKGESYDRSN